MDLADRRGRTYTTGVYLFVGDQGVIGMSRTTAEQNGWSTNDVNEMDLDEFSRRRFLGFTRSVNPEVLGPGAKSLDRR